MRGIQRKGVEFGAKGGIQRKRVEFGSKSGIRAFHTGIRIPYWNSRFHRGIQPKGVEFTKQRGIGRRGLGDVGRTKAPDVDFFARLPVGSKSNKTGRGSVSLI